jgi:hypothetical protein
MINAIDVAEERMFHREQELANCMAGVRACVANHAVKTEEFVCACMGLN